MIFYSFIQRNPQDYHERNLDRTAIIPIDNHGGREFLNLELNIKSAEAKIEKKMKTRKKDMGNSKE